MSIFPDHLVPLMGTHLNTIYIILSLLLHRVARINSFVLIYGPANHNSAAACGSGTCAASPGAERRESGTSLRVVPEAADPAWLHRTTLTAVTRHPDTSPASRPPASPLFTAPAPDKPLLRTWSRSCKSLESSHRRWRSCTSSVS